MGREVAREASFFFLLVVGVRRNLKIKGLHFNSNLFPGQELLVTREGGPILAVGARRSVVLQEAVLKQTI